MEFEGTSEREENIASQIVDAAYIVHKALGPGLLEKVYEVYLITLVSSCLRGYLSN